MQPANFPLVPSGKALRVVAGGRSFLKRQPLIAKALPTGFGFLFGDVLTQAAQWRGSQQQRQQHQQAHQQHEQRREPAEQQEGESFLQCYDPTRGAAMLCVGAFLAAPLLLGVLRGMDLVLAAPHSLGANALKFTVDQVIGCALWQAAYCTIHPPYRHAVQAVLASAAAGVEQQSAVVRRRLQPQPAALA